MRWSRSVYVRIPMRILVVVAFVLLSVGSVDAAPCADKATCATACEGGDPAACALAGYATFSALGERKVPVAKGKVQSCDDAPMTCNLYAAHLWAGVGVKKNRNLAVVLWSDSCDNEDNTGCLAHAMAVLATSRETAISELVTVCSSIGHPAACKIAGKSWKRQSGVAGKPNGLPAKQTMAFTIELPAILVAHKWTGAWYVAHKNSSGGWPDIEVSVENGQLACKGPSKSRAADNAEWLESGWAERACKSVKPAP